ncbi:hypothetical protein PAEPH01_2524 [Pancytospora epiphaga]|nr:hypothetical protein PAEPH01_2524 [Pancytospora epiphaga]
MLWLNEEGNTLTVDQFIAAKLEREGESEKPLPEDDDTVIDDFPVISSDFPKLVNIGKRTDKCYHCGALAFPTERIKSCCKKGAVWIPPLKILAPEIKAIFQKCYKRCLISVNLTYQSNTFLKHILFFRATQPFQWPVSTIQERNRHHMEFSR